MLREPFPIPESSPAQKRTALTADYTALVRRHQSTSVPVRPRTGFVFDSIAIFGRAKRGVGCRIVHLDTGYWASQRVHPGRGVRQSEARTELAIGQTARYQVE